eukprot:CAMPEP_0169314192 /NCGR_PEP_ID=MMETSP1017-20121227/4975_1 /TAXON_ID=342587 /ORGANISM="Karlodinium micrum, Strain CCMP2283" /LENGTH=258 /DNA_ID=CAMNT_0009408091 /DNA_START=54 /DNA_END=827 /DNA_ORIENTATION=+
MEPQPPPLPEGNDIAPQPPPGRPNSADTALRSPIRRCQPDEESEDDACIHSASGQPSENQAEFDMPRPAAAPGRPLTRRMRDGYGSMERQTAQSRKVVYVDHHHVHHHHHFHEAGEGGKLGSIPSEGERQNLELEAEAGVERARGPPYSTSQAFPRKAGVGQGQSRSNDVRRFHGSVRVGIAGPKSKQYLLSPPPTADGIYTAESLFSRDPCWPVGMPSTGMRTCTVSTSENSNAAQSLPLGEYLNLISQLKPESRLK